MHTKMLFLTCCILSSVLLPTFSIDPINEEYSIRTIVQFPDTLNEIIPSEEVELFDQKVCTPSEEVEFFDENVCTLSEENWSDINDILVNYMVTSNEANNVTGSFNYTKLLSFMSQERFDNFVASECDEEFDMQETMSLKIGVVAKGYLLRQGKCGKLLSREESCDRTQLILDKTEKHGTSKKGHSKRNHSKRSHSKKTHSKREHSKNKN